MFSVIIPLYNKESHVGGTIQTVLDQTMQDFEIIVIDDGSSDQSRRIVQNINSDKIRLYSQENQGVSVARNNGAKKADYDNLLFLDADDGLMPTYLSEMSALIDEYPQAGIYSTNFYNYKSRFDALILRPVNFLPEQGIVDDYFETIQKYGNILASVTVIKKDAFHKAGGYPEGMVNGEDTHLLSKILLKEKLCFLNKPLFYRTYDSENQASARYQPSQADESLLDYLGTGVKKADEYIIDYSLGQVAKLIKSGYRKEALKHLDCIISVVPDHLTGFAINRMQEIKKLRNKPYFYFRIRKIAINKLVYIKDVLKYRLDVPV